jgi:hypothetical protein
MQRTSQPSNSYQSGSFNQQASTQRNPTNFTTGGDLQAEKDAFLRYATSGDALVISGSSDYGLLQGLKDSITKLKTDFFSRSGSITFKAEERGDLDRRFLLFEHELDGLLRRRIEYSAKDFEGGTRNLDFTSLLNEKENQIVELERKILNLEDRLRRASAREVEL